MWCIKKIDGEYLANMEDILDIYSQPFDNQCTRLCFDERPILLIGDVAEPIPMKKGQNKRVDYEFERGEAVVALLAYNIDTGQRHVAISKTKKKTDYAQFLHNVIQTHYKNVPKIHLIQDNLNTHTKGSFYQTFHVDIAAQYRKLLEFHFTPKHASWLNMAEIEFSALSKQCLNRRFDSVQTLEKNVAAWEMERNKKAVKINWSFTTQDARVKLERHYKNVFNGQ